MRFLAPSLLLGLLAAVVPWYVHRLGRRRANPLRFAALQLLLRAEREVAARRRLRDAVLLVVRTAVAAALPLLFSRPYTEVRSDLPASTSRPQTAIVILDDSASMQRRTSPLAGSTLFEAARARARALLEGMAPESDVALLLASEGSPSPVAEPSSDRGRLLAALEAAQVSARRADLTAALGRAAQVARAGARADRNIYLVTDLQATGFASEAAPLQDVGVTLVPVGANESWDNRAVTDLAAAPAPELGTQGLAIVAEIANFSARPAAHLAVALRVDGEEVGRGFVDIAPGGRLHKRFLHAFPVARSATVAAAAPHEIEVAIDPDRFPLDDARRTRVEISRGLHILVVDGDPRTVRNEDEVFFLEAALRAGGGHFQVQVVLPDELSARNLGDYAAIFLANVARPSQAAAAALVRYVEAGGGVFISVGDKIDTDVWNQRLNKLLPQPLGLRRTAAARPGTQDGETIDTRPAERLGPIDRRHPLLAGFTAGGEGLASARFFQYQLLEPSPGDGARHVVLRYETGAPALVEAEVGAGRVLLLTSTVDREWTDLPIRPGFLPLIQEAARRLGGAPSGDAIATLIVGAGREIRCTAEDRRIEITKPSGEARTLIPEAPPDASAKTPDPAGRPSRVVVFRDTDQLGTYRVRALRGNGAWVDRSGDAFIVNLDTRESDPAILPAGQRPDRQGRQEAAGDRPPLRHLELWHVLGGVLVALLLIEAVLTARFRREPRAADPARGVA